MRVTMLDGGHFTSAAGVWREGESMERPIRFPIPVYLIETASERILVDTGLHPGAAADIHGHYGDDPTLDSFRLELSTPLERQLDLGSLTRVVMTHLHFDHAGGLEQLPDSVPVVVQRREWEAGHDSAAIARNFYRPRDYEGIADRVLTVDGDHDLLGDGSVRLLLTPGHTPGHQSLQVGDQLVIGGDVTHFAAGLDDLRLPIFGDDLDAQRASARRLRALRDAGLEVRPGHDPDILSAGQAWTVGTVSGRSQTAE